MSDPNRIYLDHNASAPLLDAARAALVDALDLTANATATHREGQAARRRLERARREVAQMVNAAPESIIFTSGASEAATQALAPRWVEAGEEVDRPYLAVLATDHACFHGGGRFEPDSVTRLPVDRYGLVDLSALTAWCEKLSRQGLRGIVAVNFANAETGVIQPADRIADAVAGHDVRLIVDAVQAVGRIPVDLGALRADALVLSGHKIGAAKGVGALVLARSDVRPVSLVRGGGQESGRRAGTEALPAIASFGAAAAAQAGRLPAVEAIGRKRDRMEAALLGAIEGAVVLGQNAPRIANTTAIAVPGLAAETTQIALDLKGFAISAGSACASGKVGPSHVAQALADAGAPIAPRAGLVRISLGLETDEAECDRFVEAFIAQALRGGGGQVRAA